MKMIIAGGNLRTWPKTLGRNSYDICGQKGVMRPDITYGQTGTILGMCYVSSLRHRLIGFCCAAGSLGLCCATGSLGLCCGAWLQRSATKEALSLHIAHAQYEGYRMRQESRNNRRHSINPMSRRHSIDAMSRRHSIDAMSRRHSIDAMSRRHSIDPMSRRHISGEMEYHACLHSANISAAFLLCMVPWLCSFTCGTYLVKWNTMHVCTQQTSPPHSCCVWCLDCVHLVSPVDIQSGLCLGDGGGHSRRMQAMLQRPLRYLSDHYPVEKEPCCLSCTSLTMTF